MTVSTGGQMVISTLKRAGVDTAFGINGAHVDSIYQAALDDGFRIIDVRHEMNAGHAAEGYARVRGDVGVAILTAGGGFTNAVTSMANAFLDRTPVVYIAGSGPLSLDQSNDLQSGIDQVAMASPVTKWAHRVTRTELIPRLLAQAVRVARSAPAGPVLLDIPWDVLRESVELPEDVNRLNLDGHGAAAPSSLDDIERRIRSAERPVALIGKPFAADSDRAALHRFAERSGVPLVSDYDGLGAILGTPQGIGLVQILATLPSDEKPDLIIMLGVRFGLTTALTSGTLIPHGIQIVQIDSSGAELGRLETVALAIQADPGATVSALAERFERPSAPSTWTQRLSRVAEERTAAVMAEKVPGDRIHPLDAVTAIATSLPSGSTVVADGALTYLWLSETIAKSNVAHYLCHGYLGSMGVGMGTALGAQSARPGEITVLVTGDGAVGYSLAEFDTMVRAELPVVVIVLNNRAWGATWHAQEIVLGRDRVTNNALSNGSYSAVARALGADGYEVTRLNELADAITKAIAAGRPACIDVQVDLDPIPPEEKVLMGGLPFGAGEA
ncbi:thiamine pyrophosphate-binding protein [Subtercola endophyticus]|uniref:thiamine pyrophosphate-binding protein n=1 Tax=Subtercola endophyticus TaxID=2895559 RepID=UPI001E2BADE8|nr:thiamine pyrophosphate-binding protein [Subtercola endophyticus]UFS59809.1 thiamine pyrophosphate-binding protein [Subtercola endophyticus]